MKLRVFFFWNGQIKNKTKLKTLEKLEQGHKAFRRLCRILFCYSFLSELEKLRNKEHNLADSMEIV